MNGEQPRITGCVVSRRHRRWHWRCDCGHRHVTITDTSGDDQALTLVCPATRASWTVNYPWSRDR